MRAPTARPYLAFKNLLELITENRATAVDGSELARAFFTFAALVGAAMCSAFRCGSHDRWP